MMILAYCCHRAFSMLLTAPSLKEYISYIFLKQSQTNLEQPNKIENSKRDGLYPIGKEEGYNHRNNHQINRR